MKEFFKRLSILLFAFPLFAEQKIYIGPDVFYRYYEEKIPEPRKSKEIGWLPGFQAGWDLYRSFFPYLGADLRFAEGKTRFIGTSENTFFRTVRNVESHSDNTLLNFEGRLGYTLNWGKISLSPFFGMGFQRWMRGLGNYTELYTWGYLAEGVRLRCSTTSWMFGLNLKAMQMKMSEIQICGVYSWPVVLTLGNEWQLETEAPISWLKNPYEISLVPYFRYLPIGQSNTQTTSRGTIFEPASNTYVAGARLEFAYRF
ncbi:MAG: hypothetical protein JSS32_05135 [Verrucomicrobia bacterium]|nr:hypothetical protein [Verrucomicrobiota bacterium]